MARRILSADRLRRGWWWGGTPAFALAATLVAATAVQTQTPVSDVSVVGCVKRQPDSIPAPPVGHEQEAARGLSLTQVRTKTDEQQAFWLVGDKAIELARFVDRQAEVQGRFDERNRANPGDADAGAVPGRRSTGAPPPRPDAAHPSAPTRTLRVASFRVLAQGCR